MFESTGYKYIFKMFDLKLNMANGVTNIKLWLYVGSEVSHVAWPYRGVYVEGIFGCWIILQNDAEFRD